MNIQFSMKTLLPLACISAISIENFLIRRSEGRLTFKEKFLEEARKAYSGGARYTITNFDDLEKQIMIDKKEFNNIFLLKFAYWKSARYPELEKIANLFIPLMAVNSFFAPTATYRLCQLYLFGRFGCFIYSFFKLRKGHESETNHRSIHHGGISFAILVGLGIMLFFPTRRYFSTRIKQGYESALVEIEKIQRDKLQEAMQKAEKLEEKKQEEEEEPKKLS